MSNAGVDAPREEVAAQVEEAVVEGTFLDSGPEMGAVSQKIFSSTGVVAEVNVNEPSQYQAQIEWMLKVQRNLANDHESPSNIDSFVRQVQDMKQD